VLSTEPQVIANYADTGLIRYVYYPMLDHGPTQKTYEAAECAGAQDPAAFWRIHDADLYVEFAQGAGVADLDQFRRCLDSGQYATKAIDLDRARSAAGIRLRPTFSIDGRLIPGAQSYQQLSQLIDAALTQQ
jgi:protein-disulfide isomerase